MDVEKLKAKFSTPGSWVLVGVVAVLGIFVIWCLSAFASARSTGPDKETALNAEYAATQVQLDTTLKQIKETLGVANVKAEKLDQVLTNAVKGRYDGETSAVPGGQPAFFSAIAEAYPDLTALNTFDKVQDTVVAGREAFRRQQAKMQDRLRDYDRWRKAGVLKPIIISMAGYPSELLEARIGGQTFTGEAARDKMRQIVTSSATQESFRTGRDEGIDFGE